MSHAGSSGRKARCPRPERSRPPVVDWRILLLCLAVLLAYANSFSGVFVFDDLPNIVRNASIRHLSDPGRVLHPPPEAGIGGRPLVNLTLALNYALSGLAPWSYHALNLLIHLLAAWTLYGILHRTFRAPPLQDRWGAIARDVSFAAALLWALHPLQTQAVTYVIQRCESLMGLWFLLALYGAIRGWEADSGRSRGCVLRWHALAVGSCLLGVGTKEVIVAAPVLVLLYDLLFVHRRFGDALRSSRWLYGGFLLCLALLAAQVVTVSLQLPDRASLPFTAWQYAVTQSQVILHYLRLTVWPAPLVLDYEWPVASLRAALPHILATLVLLAATVVGLVRARPAAYAAAWFFAILAPTSSLVPIKDLAFEHRLYLSLAGITVLGVSAVYLIGRRLFARQQRTATGRSCGRGRWPAWILLAAVALLLGGLTAARNHDYRSALALWEDTVSKRPQNSRAHLSLGVALSAAGRESEALAHLQEAVRLRPDYPSARTNLGIAMLERGQAGDAAAHLEAALRGDPRHVEARVNLGVAYCQLGQLARGAEELRAALRLQPDHANAHFNLAVALMEMGEGEEAARHFRRALRLEPDNVVARQLLQSLTRPPPR